MCEKNIIFEQYFQKKAFSKVFGFDFLKKCVKIYTEVNMGLFGKLFQMIGFESSSDQTKTQRKKEAAVSTKASYKLNKREVVEKIDNIDGIKVYYPESFEDAKKFYAIFKNGEPIILNFDYTDENDTEKIKAYFLGVCDATNVQFVDISGEKMYILLPEGVEIEN